MANLGFLLALGTAVCWGSYMVPFKKLGNSNLIQFQALMGTGIGLSGLIMALILGYSFNLSLYALLSGFMWVVANSLALFAVFNLGISRAVPLVSSLVIISSFLWGILFFGELPTGSRTGFMGLGLIILGVVLVGMIGNAASQNIRKGLLAGILAGLLFGSQFIPLKVGRVATEDFFLPFCLGIFLFGLVFVLAKGVKIKIEGIKEGLFSGVIWNIGNLLSLISLNMIGLAKMGPVSQVAVLIAVLWGIVYFKEVPDLRARLQVLMGASILFAGVIVMAFA